jgi:hypothetical protein
MLDRLRENVALYLDGKIDAVQLQQRLPDGWDTDQAGNATVTRLVLRVIGYLSEFQNGDLSEADLRDRLRLALPSARTYWIEQARRTVVAGSDATLIDPKLHESTEISRVVESV